MFAARALAALPCAFTGCFGAGCDAVLSCGCDKESAPSSEEKYFEKSLSVAAPALELPFCTPASDDAAAVAFVAFVAFVAVVVAFVVAAAVVVAGVLVDLAAAMRCASAGSVRAVSALVSRPSCLIRSARDGCVAPTCICTQAACTWMLCVCACVCVCPCKLNNGCMKKRHEGAN